MHHLSLFRLAAPGAVVGADVPAVPDDAVTISQNGHLIFDLPVEIPLAYMFGTVTLTRGQVATPKLRTYPLPNIVPVDRALVPTSRPPHQHWWQSPLKLNPIDEIQCLTFDTAGATDIIGAYWVCDGNYSAPSGQMVEVHGSGTIVSVADTWTAGNFVLDQPLPAGVYTVVGMRVFGPNMAFGRLIFPRPQQGGSPSWRPGVLAGITADFIGIERLLEGYMGAFGSFDSYSQPKLEIYTHGGAGSTQDVYLQLIRTGGPTHQPAMV